MDFDFSAEQQALREQLLRLFTDGRGRARRVMESGARYDAELWRHAVEMGLPAAAVPEAQGGHGLGHLELCVTAEEAGRSLAPIPLSPSVFHATEALKLAGGEAAAQWLPRLAVGEALGTVAFNEQIGTWDRVPAARVENGRLLGVKTPVALASANFAVVSASAPEDGAGYGWWLAELNAEGVGVQAIETLDRMRQYAEITFDRAPVQRLGAPGQGAELTARLLNIAAILCAFEQLGGAEALLKLCVEYAKTRRAFGTFIGTNQAVKHRLADLYTKLQLARGHCYYGAWALATMAPELSLAAAGARLAATEAFGFAAEEAIQLHGGIGFTWENDCHLYYRRARVLALELGSRRRWTNHLSEELSAWIDAPQRERVHGL